MGSIGSSNSLSLVRHQAITWTNVDSLSTEPLDTNFREIPIKIQDFLLIKMHFRTSSVKWQPFCLRHQWVKNPCLPPVEARIQGISSQTSLLPTLISQCHHANKYHQQSLQLTGMQSLLEAEISQNLHLKGVVSSYWWLHTILQYIYCEYTEDTAHWLIRGDLFLYFDGLTQDCSICLTSTLEILQYWNIPDLTFNSVWYKWLLSFNLKQFIDKNFKIQLT